MLRLVKILLDWLLTPVWATPWSLIVSVTQPNRVEAIMATGTLVLITIGVAIPWPFVAVLSATLYMICLIGRVITKEPALLAMMIYAVFFGTLLRVLWEIIPWR